MTSFRDLESCFTRKTRLVSHAFLSLNLRSDHNFPGNYDPWRQKLPGNQDFEVLISRSFNFLLHRQKFSSVSFNVERVISIGRGMSCVFKLPPLNPHKPLIAWETWSHTTIWKIHISTFTRLMATELVNKFVVYYTWLAVIPASKFRSVFQILLNIYDGAFLQKLLTVKYRFLFSQKVSS